MYVVRMIAQLCLKRNIIRHMTLVQAMVYRSISPPVMRKYPTLASLVEAGYLEPNEVERFSENNYYQSVSWALALAREARDEGIIKSDPALQDIFRICMDFRWSQITLFYYHWIPMPLAFSQIIALVVRCYFILALLGRQFTHHENNRFPIDLYFPAITVLQLIFYAGWVKVAEALINPCGDDDENFDFEEFLTRNMNQAIAIADEKNSEPPPLCWDKFWSDEENKKQEEKATIKRAYYDDDRAHLQTLKIHITSNTKEEAESITSMDSGKYSDISIISPKEIINIEINK
uniref:Bestrophin homolog n=1 Tax=Ascaris suum TaxID=6253 RepID=F1L9G7_ASCSU